jgi:hypothetical protein
MNINRQAFITQLSFSLSILAGIVSGFAIPMAQGRRQVTKRPTEPTRNNTGPIKENPSAQYGSPSTPKNKPLAIKVKRKNKPEPLALGHKPALDESPSVVSDNKIQSTMVGTTKSDAKSDETANSNANEISVTPDSPDTPQVQISSPTKSVRTTPDTYGQLLLNPYFAAPDRSDEMPTAWDQSESDLKQPVTIKKGKSLPIPAQGNIVLIDGVVDDNDGYHPGLHQSTNLVYNSEQSITGLSRLLWLRYRVKCRLMHFEKVDSDRVRSVRISLYIVDADLKVICSEFLDVAERPNGKNRELWSTFSFIADFEPYSKMITMDHHKLMVEIRSVGNYGKRTKHPEGLYVDAIELHPVGFLS